MDRLNKRGNTEEKKKHGENDLKIKLMRREKNEKRLDKASKKKYRIWKEEIMGVLCHNLGRNL